MVTHTTPLFCSLFFIRPLVGSWKVFFRDNIRGWGGQSYHKSTSGFVHGLLEEAKSNQQEVKFHGCFALKSLVPAKWYFICVFIYFFHSWGCSVLVQIKSDFFCLWMRCFFWKFWSLQNGQAPLLLCPPVQNLCVKFTHDGWSGSHRGRLLLLLLEMLTATALNTKPSPFLAPSSPLPFMVQSTRRCLPWHKVLLGFTPTTVRSGIFWPAFAWGVGWYQFLFREELISASFPQIPQFSVICPHVFLVRIFLWIWNGRCNGFWPFQEGTILQFYNTFFLNLLHFSQFGIIVFTPWVLQGKEFDLEEISHLYQFLSDICHFAFWAKKNIHIFGISMFPEYQIPFFCILLLEKCEWRVKTSANVSNWKINKIEKLIEVFSFLFNYLSGEMRAFPMSFFFSIFLRFFQKASDIKFTPCSIQPFVSCFFCCGRSRGGGLTMMRKRTVVVVVVAAEHHILLPKYDPGLIFGSITEHLQGGLI